jgi:hypothetical protein
LVESLSFTRHAQEMHVIKGEREKEKDIVDTVNPCYSFFLFDLSLSLSFTFAEKQKN